MKLRYPSGQPILSLCGSVIVEQGQRGPPGRLAALSPLPAAATQDPNAPHLPPERSAENNEFGFGDSLIFSAGRRARQGLQWLAASCVCSAPQQWSVVAPQQNPESPLKKKTEKAYIYMYIYMYICTHIKETNLVWTLWTLGPGALGTRIHRKRWTVCRLSSKTFDFAEQSTISV